jgi:hypothetical protein
MDNEERTNTTEEALSSILGFIIFYGVIIFIICYAWFYLIVPVFK